MPETEVVTPAAEPETPTENAPATAEGQSPESAAPAPVPDLSDLGKEALPALSALESLGITTENARDLLFKAHTLDQTRYQLENNPRMFLDEIERINPGAFERLIDKASDRYVEKYGKDVSSPDGRSTTPEVAALRSELESIKQERAQESHARLTQEQTARAAQIEGDLRVRISSLIGKASAKSPIAKHEAKGIEAQIMESLGKDPAAAMAIVNGNFSPVTGHTVQVLNSFYKERAESATSDKTNREHASENGVKDLPSAASPVAGESRTSAADWDSAAQNMARQLSKGRK